MPDMEKVIKGLRCHMAHDCRPNRCPYEKDDACTSNVFLDAIELLEEQDERLRKLQKDKDKLCLEVSKWKHKFHDAPPTFVSQADVEQIRWERDTALSQLDEIGKGLGSKMDDIVSRLKEQETMEQCLKGKCLICPHCKNCDVDENGLLRDLKPVKPKMTVAGYMCGSCGRSLVTDALYCHNCGRPVEWGLNIKT